MTDRRRGARVAATGFPAHAAVVVGVMGTAAVVACVVTAIALADGQASEDGQVVLIDTQATFDRYREATFEAGTVIAFARGRSFSGRFAPQGRGSADAPIRVTAYDPQTREPLWRDVSDKPAIHGHGEVNAPVYLHNPAYWEVQNLEVTNTDGTDADQGDLRGIHAVAEDVGVIEHLIIRHNHVHSVNGKVAGKQRGGIHVHVVGDAKPTRFDHVRIEHNVVRDVGGVGIGNQSSWRSIDSDDYHPWTDLVIAHNHVERTGRNGIIVRASIEPLVEHNTLIANSRHSTGHSVFNFNTVGCVMQYNEAYGNVGHPDDNDRGGYDADWNSRGTVIQYNYSHGNHWFAGIMRRPINEDVIIRYNISENDLFGAYFYGFPGSAGVRNVHVYNNTHYFGEGSEAHIFANPAHPAGERTPIETVFRNNIFYFAEAGGWGVEPDEQTTRFSHNVFYNVEPRGEHAVTADPQLVAPGGAGRDVDMHDPDRLAGYRLRGNSPAIGAGTKIENHGGRDFWGQPLYHGQPDIGAHERQSR